MQKLKLDDIKNNTLKPQQSDEITVVIMSIFVGIITIMMRSI